MLQAEIEESNLHSREFWKLFAQASPGGEVFSRNGLSIADAKQPWIRQAHPAPSPAICERMFG